MTAAEKRCIAAFRAAKRKAGTLPTIQEVASELGHSKQYAEALLNRLVIKERFEKNGRYRAYREIPRVTKVAA